MANLTEDQQRQTDAAREQLQANREAQAQRREAQGRIVEDADVKPTPTQEENDMAKLGAYIPEHEPDGSPEQPAVLYPDQRGQQPGQPQPGQPQERQHQTRQMEPGRRGQFTTRSQPPQNPQTPDE